MKRRLLVSGLVTVSGLMSGLVAAQEVGKVLASTPVMKRVTEPKSTCTKDADGRQNCRTQMVTEDRTVGYKVVYEYAGRQHTVQLPFLPGATIELEVTPVAVARSATPSAPPRPDFSAEAQPRYPAQPQPTYSSPPQPTYSSPQQPIYTSQAEPAYYSEPPVVVERYVREPVYIDPPYYPRSYYYPGYYFDPFYPIVGLALGYTAGYYGRGWRGGYGYGHGYGNWRGGGHRGR